MHEEHNLERTSHMTGDSLNKDPARGPYRSEDTSLEQGNQVQRTTGWFP